MRKIPILANNISEAYLNLFNKYRPQISHLHNAEFKG